MTDKDVNSKTIVILQQHGIHQQFFLTIPKKICNFKNWKRGQKFSVQEGTRGEIIFIPE